MYTETNDFSITKIRNIPLNKKQSTKVGTSIASMGQHTKDDAGAEDVPKRHSYLCGLDHGSNHASNVRMKTDGENLFPSCLYFYIYPVHFRICGKMW